jgi:exonuclease III
VLSAAAKGQFTYWSQRLFHRGPNKGIRLDYFICSKDMFPAAEGSADGKGTKSTESVVQVHDSYILHADTVGCSDHCPVMLVVKV